MEQKILAVSGSEKKLTELFGTKEWQDEKEGSAARQRRVPTPRGSSRGRDYVHQPKEASISRVPFGGVKVLPHDSSRASCSSGSLSPRGRVVKLLSPRKKDKPGRAIGSCSSASAEKSELSVFLAQTMQQRNACKSQRAADKYDKKIAQGSDIEFVSAYAMQPSSEWGDWDFDQDQYLNAFVTHHLKAGDLIQVLSMVIEADLAAKTSDKFEFLLREGLSFTCKLVTAASIALEGGPGKGSVEEAVDRTLKNIRALSIEELKALVMLPNYIHQALQKGLWELDDKLSGVDASERELAIAERNYEAFSLFIKNQLFSLLVGEAHSAPILQLTDGHQALLGVIRTCILHACNRCRDRKFSSAEMHALALEQVASALFLKRFNPLLTIGAAKALGEIQDQSSPEYARAWHVHAVAISYSKVLQKFANHQRFEKSDGFLERLNRLLWHYTGLFDQFLDDHAPIKVPGSR